MNISAVIPTRNRVEQVRSTLHSLLRQTRQVDEILLIDSSDDRRQTALLRQEFAGHPIQWSESVPSVCIQRNIGIARASGDWILLLDDDVDLESDYILKLETYILANDGCGAVAGRLMQLESGTWTDQYPVKRFGELCWRFIFQLSIWGRIDEIKVPGVMKWCVEIINDFYRRKGNTLSLAGWPLITQWNEPIVRTTIYSLGASLIRKEWLANGYDEVLDPYGIGDNYGAALNFPARQQIHVLRDARAYHHRASENRLDRTLASYRRSLALHYFLVRNKKGFVTKSFFVWSLFGNSLAAILRGDSRTFRMTMRALALILCGRNPYWIGHLKNKKIVQPFP
jgi:glycosyltransferase involved in cell wall biosynthesis